MPLSLTNITQGSIADSTKGFLLDNKIASAFGMGSETDTFSNFITKFGSNSVFLPENKTFTIRSQNFFTTSIKFFPECSKVCNLLTKALIEKTQDNLKYFIQGVDVPALTVAHDEQEISTGFLGGSIAGHIIKPQNRTFEIKFLNTEFSLMDHVFYFWIKETVNNEWCYPLIDSSNKTLDIAHTAPFTKADITISFTSMKTNEVLHSVVLTNCFPITISMPQVSQDMRNEHFIRTVNFQFDNIYVDSTFVGSTWEDKLKNGLLDDVFNSFIGNKIKNTISIAENNISNNIMGNIGSVVNRQ